MKKVLIVAILFLMAFVAIKNISADTVLAESMQYAHIEFCYQSHTWVYDAGDIESQDFFVLPQGHKYGRWGSNTERQYLLNKIHSMGFDARQSMQYVFCGIDDVFEKIEKAINTPYVDASFSFDTKRNKVFQFIPEKVGYKVDYDQIFNDILLALNKNLRLQINIKPTILQPQVLLSDLIKYDNVRSSFFTSFSAENENRVSNIRLATSCFDGLVIKNGTEYSFNEITGRRSEERGYKSANIIVDKKYVEGFGGGVCQVSTTLYNALLLAGVDVVEVHNHTLVSNYVNKGFDAMVNYGTSDLRWINNTGGDLFLQGVVTSNQIKFVVYGEYSPYRYQRITEITQEIKPADDQIIVDTEGQYQDKVYYVDECAYITNSKNGYKVNAYLDKYLGENLLEHKLLRKVTYHSVTGQKVYGTHPREKEQKIQSTTINSELYNFWKNFCF